MAKNTILLKGDLGRRYEEARANGAITPGHLCEIDANAEIKVHATAGAGAAGPWGGAVAIEDALSGKDLVNTKGNTIDDAYADDGLVRYIMVAPGEIVNLILATSQTISVGDRLTSNGNGQVKEANGTTDANLFRAVEAVTTTGATARIAAERL